LNAHDTPQRRTGTPVTAIAMTLLIALMTGCKESPKGRVPVTIGNRTFELEIAADAASHTKGLSNRSSIDADGGMLFVFEDAAIRRFWMRQCQVPIDILFLDAGGRVVATHAMPIEPADTPDEKLPLYSSNWPAMYAIELRGGTLQSMPVELGTKITLPVERLKAIAH
jgi:uncharacterized membrane protein (UPF0127 family)